MKCYFLDGIESAEKGMVVLQRHLPGEETRILFDESGDPMAYFDLVPVDSDPDLSAPYIRACISGRHYHCDAQVLTVLEALRSELGGTMKDDK